MPIVECAQEFLFFFFFFMIWFRFSRDREEEEERRGGDENWRREPPPPLKIYQPVIFRDLGLRYDLTLRRVIVISRNAVHYCAPCCTTYLRSWRGSPGIVLPWIGDATFSTSRWKRFAGSVSFRVVSRREKDRRKNGSERLGIIPFEDFSLFPIVAIVFPIEV